MPGLRSFFTGHFTEFRAPDIFVRNAADKEPVINAAAAYKNVFAESVTANLFVKFISYA